jgi:hypothetical protein
MIHAPSFTIVEEEPATPREPRKRKIPLAYDPKMMWNQQSPELVSRERMEERHREQQKYMEERRYLEALREQFINRVKEKNVEIPPLCTCYGVRAFDPCMKHAQNCQFYKNPKLYARALSSLLTSMGQHKS